MSGSPAFIASRISPCTMKNWIAHEHDETGWPTESCLIVAAPTQTEAKQLMSSAITARCSRATRQQRDRLYAIFIEAPQELPAEDPRHALISGPATRTFVGFDEDPPENRRRPTTRR
jgi:hypothetical protein